MGKFQDEVARIEREDPEAVARIREHYRRSAERQRELSTWPRAIRYWCKQLWRKA